MSPNRNVKNMMFAGCKPDPMPDARELSEPGPCSSQHDLRNKPPAKYSSLHTNASILPITSLKHTTKLSSKQTSDLSSKPVPDSWSWRDRGGNMIEDGSRNQAQCGCCWAMATVSALSDRYAIKYKTTSHKLSAVPVISCGGPTVASDMNPKTQQSCDGCGGFPANAQCACGGSTLAAGYWLESPGNTKLESCWPFSVVTDGASASGDVAPNCPHFASDCCLTCCGNPDADKSFTVEKGSTHAIVITKDGKLDVDAIIHAIKLDVMAHGPVVATFWLPGTTKR